MTLGVPKAFLAHGKPDEILAGLGLDGDGLAATVLAAMTGAPLPTVPLAGLEH